MIVSDDLGLLPQRPKFYNSFGITRSEAAERFAEAGKRQPAPELHLRADQSVAYRAVAETLADASKAGLHKIGFVSEPEER